MVTFNLDNIIGIDALDMDVCPTDSVEEWNFSLLVLDPGKMVGWAGVLESTQESLGVVGQAPWYECLDIVAKRVVVERTPYAARRTFDPWPMYYTGMVMAKIFPNEIETVLPTSLKVNQKWFALPKKHGLGPHAKDALTHLVGVLVKDATR